MWQYQNTDELYHHGILGMKWGIRRYQNKDGSLTPIGKKRYKSRDYIDARKIKKKKISQMSNQELRRLNERQKLETQYKQNNSRLKKGAAAVIGTAAVIGAVSTIYKKSPELIKSGKRAVNNVLNSNYGNFVKNKVPRYSIPKFKRIYR